MHNKMREILQPKAGIILTTKQHEGLDDGHDEKAKCFFLTKPIHGEAISWLYQL